MRPKKSTSPEANAKLFDAAMHAFNRRGFSSARTSEIAVMGDTSETAIFRLFKSKAGLANACLKDCLKSEYLINEDAIDLRLPNQLLFSKICENQANFFLRTPERYMFMLVTPHYDFIDEENKLLLQQRRLHAFNVVRLLMKHEKIKEQSVELVVSIFIGSFTRLAMNSFAGHLSITTKDLHAMTAILWRALGTDEKPHD